MGKVVMLLLRQSSRVVSYRPKRVWKGAWRGEGGKKTRAGSKGKRWKPKKAWKDEKTAKGIWEQMWAVQSLSRQGKVLRALQRSTDYCGPLYLSKTPSAPE